jgi:hypothetical protein
MASRRADDAIEPNEDAVELSQWGGDPLAQFLAAAWRNTVRSFSNESQHYSVIAEIDGIYRQLVSDEEINHSKRFPATFLMRSHGAFIAATSLAMSGQVAEAYVQLRAALEAALHGLFIVDAPERQQVWTSRNDDDDARRRAHEMFDGAAPLANLQTIDEATANIFEQLLARTIDRQLHPNTYASPGQPTPAGENGKDFTRRYFVCGDEVQRSCLRSVAQVGICCLTIFYYAFPDRYRELQLDASVKQLRRGH